MSQLKEETIIVSFHRSLYKLLLKDTDCWAHHVYTLLSLREASKETQTHLDKMEHFQTIVQFVDRFELPHQPARTQYCTCSVH